MESQDTAGVPSDTEAATVAADAEDILNLWEFDKVFTSNAYTVADVESEIITALGGAVEFPIRASVLRWWASVGYHPVLFAAFKPDGHAPESSFTSRRLSNETKHLGLFITCVLEVGERQFQYTFPLGNVDIHMRLPEPEMNSNTLPQVKQFISEVKAYLTAEEEEKSVWVQAAQITDPHYLCGYVVPAIRHNFILQEGDVLDEENEQDMRYVQLDMKTFRADSCSPSFRYISEKIAARHGSSSLDASAYLQPIATQIVNKPNFMVAVLRSFGFRPLSQSAEMLELTPASEVLASEPNLSHIIRSLEEKEEVHQTLAQSALGLSDQDLYIYSSNLGDDSSTKHFRS